MGADFGQGVPHPRSYGTFARVLGVYVRERNIITLEDAIRKMTSFPAQRLRIGDRGVLRPGMKADIAVFDPARVRDMATFEKPHQYAEGIFIGHRERTGGVRRESDDSGATWESASQELNEQEIKRSGEAFRKKYS